MTTTRLLLVVAAASFAGGLAAASALRPAAACSCVGPGSWTLEVRQAPPDLAREPWQGRLMLQDGQLLNIEDPSRLHLELIRVEAP
jgi:hypothetical protein